MGAVSVVPSRLDSHTKSQQAAMSACKGIVHVSLSYGWPHGLTPIGWGHGASERSFLLPDSTKHLSARVGYFWLPDRFISRSGL